MKPIIACMTFHQDEERVSLSVSPKVVLTEAYVTAVIQAGGIPVLIPVGLPVADLEAVLAMADGVLLPGGGDVHPRFYQEPWSDQILGLDVARDELEVATVQTAVAQGLPLLGICRGHQVMNVALGGTLWADLPSQMPGSLPHDFDDVQPRNYEAHGVSLVADSLLAQVLGETETAVNSLHHQGIKTLAPGLRAVAFAPDGLVEAVELPDHPFTLGVQWHPEWLAPDRPDMAKLFKQFVQAAGNGRL